MPRKNNQIRIISGKLGGRLIDTPKTDKTHPMGDRERAAIFNRLRGDIAGKDIKSILFICPDRDSYGDLFCTDIESRFKGKSFLGIYRVNYLFPLNETPSVLMDTYLQNPDLGAIVFAGMIKVCVLSWVMYPARVSPPPLLWP